MIIPTERPSTPLPSIILVLSIAVLGIRILGQSRFEPLNARFIQADVNFLADPRCEGRGVGTDGIRRAAAYIEDSFRKAGLQPAGSDGYRDAFAVTIGLRLGEGNQLVIKQNGLTEPAQMGKDFVPVVLSEPGAAEGPLVFVGHGITAPELHYDDYAGVKVRGAWVMVLEHEPQETNAKSPFRASSAYRYRELRYKAINAREHGAKGVLLVRDLHHHPAAAGPELVPFDTADPVSGAGIVVVQITNELANHLLGPNRNIRSLGDKLDASLVPGSFPVEAAVSGRVNIEQRHERAWNVVGIIPGSDPVLRRETVLIGAHYDHLGYGGHDSLSPGERVIHPGADDNASGTAGVLALARLFGRNGGPRRSVAFACFSGEELGILGSSHLAKNMPAGLGKVVAMLNMDMVGRGTGNVVQVHGTETAREWPGILARVGSKSGLDVRASGGGYGPSDHTSFYAQGIPVLFFFTGAHTDYHKPSDTPDKLNAQGEVRVLRLVNAVALEAANVEKRLLLVPAQVPPPHAGHHGGGGGGYGVFFGSIPDFSAFTGGVLLSGVVSGSPAQAAGLKAADVIVRFGGVAIANLEDLTYALRSHRPGDVVEVVYRRAGQDLKAKATLRERRKH
jgi:aminopeptidase YwaD